MTTTQHARNTNGRRFTMILTRRHFLSTTPAAAAACLAHRSLLPQDQRGRLYNRPHFIPLFNATFPPGPADSLPTLLFTDDHILRTNGATLHLHHYDPAHTDTDISVHFTDADVLHTGDTWFNGVYPF